MADSITWLLNADASAVRAEMNAAVAAVNTGTGAIAGGFSRAELAHGTFLKSNAKVAHQVENVAHSMLYGADSTTVFVTALEGLGRATKVPLAPLAALFIGATAIKSVYDYRKEWEKVNEELDKAAKPRAFGKDTSKDIEHHSEEIKKTVESAQEKIKDESWWGKFKRLIGGSMELHPGGDQPPWKTMAYYKGGQETVIKDPVREAEKKIEVAKQAQAKDAEDLAKLEHEKLVQAQSDKFKESLQFSLADIAKEGRKRKYGTFDRGFGPSNIGDQAQEALDEQMKARKAMMAGHTDEAIKHQSRAEEIKSSIGALKDSEKIVGQLSTANVTLKEIAQKVSFAGK